MTHARGRPLHHPEHQPSAKTFVCAFGRYLALKQTIVHTTSISEQLPPVGDYFGLEKRDITSEIRDNNEFRAAIALTEVYLNADASGMTQAVRLNCVENWRHRSISSGWRQYMTRPKTTQHPTKIWFER